MSRSEQRYKSGETPRGGDRVKAPPTTKKGEPRIGRVDSYVWYRRRNGTEGVRVVWELSSTRRPGSPKESTLDAAVLEKIDELPTVQEASDLSHKIASILGLPYGYGDKCQLRDGSVVRLKDLHTALRIEQLIEAEVMP